MARRFIIETVAVFLLLSITVNGSFSEFFSCNGTKNVTILRNMEPTSNPNFFQSSTLQLTFLVKSLFETPCISVWMYSVARKISIRLDEESLTHLMDTLMESSFKKDGSNIRQFLSDYAQSVDDTNEQILLVILNENDSKQTSITDELKQIKQKVNIGMILWCGEPLTADRHTTCNEARNWLPARQIINCGSTHFQPHFDPFLHKIFLGLIENISYDYYQQYNDLKCNEAEALEIFVWQSLRHHKYVYSRTFFLTSQLQNKFTAANVHLIISYYEQVFFQSSAKNFFSHNFNIAKNAILPTQVSNILDNLNNRKQIHIVVDHKGKKWQEALYEEYGKTIKVIIDDGISDSPVLEGGVIRTWNEDLRNPFLVNMIIGEMNQYLCQEREKLT
eukprot:TCONS_00033869-protein